MRINTNINSLNAQRNLWATGNKLAGSMQKLSSGFRINRAGDDAAGLGIANKLRADLRSMKAASRNAEQATAMLQIAEGATQTVSNILDRMKELATQAASDNVDDAGRTRIKAEWDQLSTELGKIADTTKFQGKQLLNGGFGNSVDTDVADSTVFNSTKQYYDVTLSGATAGHYTVSNTAAGTLVLSNGSSSQTVTGLSAGKQSVTFSQFGITVQTDTGWRSDVTLAAHDGTISIAPGSGGGSFLVRSTGAYSGDDLISVSSINLTTGASGLNLSTLSFTGDGTTSEWQSALTRLDTAVGTVNSAFGTLGAAQNRIDYANANLKTSIENYSAAESTIRDVDMAAEMSDLTKYQILQQAGTAMLAQANQLGQGVLQLLRG